MKKAAQSLEFEKAAALRDQVFDLRGALADQQGVEGAGANWSGGNDRRRRLGRPWLAPRGLGDLGKAHAAGADPAQHDFPEFITLIHMTLYQHAGHSPA